MLQTSRNLTNLKKKCADAFPLQRDSILCIFFFVLVSPSNSTF